MRLKIVEKIRIERKLENEILLHTKKKKKKLRQHVFFHSQYLFLVLRLSAKWQLPKKLRSIVYADAWQFFKVSVY